MIDKVIQSKALYGRIDIELHVMEFMPNEIKTFFQNKISDQELLKYTLLFGGVPKYLELIATKDSFESNIQRLCFAKDSYFQFEFDKIFYSQFKKHRLHEKIVTLLSHGPLSLQELADKLKISSSGGLKRYLNELLRADFIITYTLDMKDSVKNKKYNLCSFKIISNYIFVFFVTTKLKVS